MDDLDLNNNDQKKIQVPRSDNIYRILIGLMVIIALLLLCNLGATSYLIYEFRQPYNKEVTSRSESLPDELVSSQNKAALFDNFKNAFNEQDNENLFALFDPLAREEFSREKMDQQLDILYQIAGKIKSGTFSHYEYQASARGREWFILYYRIQTDQGVGTLTITIAQQNNQEGYEIWGFNINIGS